MLLFLAFCSAAATDATNPVAAIVTLLGELKAEVETDGRKEQKLYDQFACWCEETVGNTKKDIDRGTTRSKDLGASILELRGKVSSGAVEVARLKTAIAEAAESVESATSMRTNENEAYVERKTQLETGIANLGTAIEVLQNATGGGAQIETELLTVVAGVRSAVGLYSKLPGEKKDITTVKKFFSSLETKSPHMGTYQSQSDGILGMLADMKDSFTRDLADANEAEAKALKEYKGLMATKRRDQAMLKASYTKMTEESTANAADLESDSAELKETDEQLVEDQEFLKNTEKTCSTRAAEWSERSRLRTEELTGMQEALTILSEGAGTFENASTRVNASEFMNESNATLFIQVAVREPTDAAYQVLEKLQHRGRPHLAAVAATAQTTGHFDAIMGQVDRLIGTLEREGKADDYKKEWCDKERYAARETEARHEFDHGALGAKIGRLDDHKTQTENGINETNQNLEDLHTALADALMNRNAEEAASKKAQMDDMAAIRLLASAIERLGSFAANNPSFLQTMDEMVVERKHSKRNATAPPGTWSGSYGGRSSESTGVLSLLEGVKDKFSTDLAEEKETEKKAVDAYWKMRKSTELQIKTLEEELDTLDGELAKTIREISQKTKQRTDTNTSWTATTDYLEELRPECDWVESEEEDGYEPRKQARKAEIKDLQNSKLVLAGASVPELVTVRSQVSKAPASVADELQHVNNARSAFLRRA